MVKAAKPLHCVDIGGTASEPHQALLNGRHRIPLLSIPSSLWTGGEAALSTDEDKWNEEMVGGILCNPVFVGSPPFEAVVDEQARLVYVSKASAKGSSEYQAQPPLMVVGYNDKIGICASFYG